MNSTITHTNDAAEKWAEKASQIIENAVLEELHNSDLFRPMSSRGFPCGTSRSRQVSPGKRFEILRRDNYRCKLCGISPSVDTNIILEVDHIVPVSQGGTDRNDNLWTLCFACNRGKGNQSL